MPRVAQLARGAGTDGGDPHAGERAGVEPGGGEAAVEEGAHAVRRREHEPLVGVERRARVKSSGVDRDGRELEHLGAERPRAGPAARSPARVPASPPPSGRTAVGPRTTTRSSAATSPTTIALGACTPASAIVASVARTVCWSGRVPLRTAATGVSGARPPSISRCAISPMRARAHEDHEGAADPGQRLPVDVGAVLGRVLVPGHHGEVGRHAAVGHRDARVGGRADGAGDAGHHLEGDAGGGERLGLLAAAPEHERVAALEPHHALGRSAPRSTRTALICSWVRSTWPGALPGGDQLGARGREREERGRRQPVVHHDVGAPRAARRRAR